MDIIILGLVACFIFYKLSKILGKIDDEERNNIEEKIRKQKEASEQFLNSLNLKKQQDHQEIVTIGSSSTEDINFSDLDLSNLDNLSKENLSQITKTCNISVKFFINGAKSAFEMIIKAFGAGDLETLKFLLAEKIYKGFEIAVNQRRAENKNLVTNLISIDKAEILSVAIVNQNIASIAVKFISKQINYITNHNNEVIEGKKDEIVEINDIWTFKKDILSQDPNWKIVSTGA